MKIVVYHGSYGCDTGCCGHYIEVDCKDGPGSGSKQRFDFGHPYDGNLRKYAEDLVREKFGEEHVKDLDWENCVITDNC